MLTDPRCRETILPITRHDTLSVDENLWLQRCIYGSHDDVCIETLAWIEYRFLRYHVGTELIHTDIFHVNIGN